MASANVSGSARFTFSSTTLSSPFLLAYPLEFLSDFGFGQPDSRWIWRSLDGSGRNVVAISSTKTTVTGVIRRDDQPDTLRQFLRDAMDVGVTSLLYKQSSTDTGVSVDIDAVNGGTSVELTPDRSGIGWEARIRMVLAEADLASLL